MSIFKKLLRPKKYIKDLSKEAKEAEKRQAGSGRSVIQGGVNSILKNSKVVGTVVAVGASILNPLAGAAVSAAIMPTIKKNDEYVRKVQATEEFKRQQEQTAKNALALQKSQSVQAGGDNVMLVILLLVGGGFLLKKFL